MRVLALHSKHAFEYWLADTPEHENWAFLQMFNFCDAQEYYADLKPDPSDEKAKDKLRTKIKAAEGVWELSEELQELKRHLAELEGDRERVQSQLELHQKAKAGDAKAARKLCQKRQGYEYEDFEFVNVNVP